MPNQRLRRSSNAVLSAPALLACGLTALPKCPFCLLALMAVVGIESMPLAAWVTRLFPIMIVAAALSLGVGSRGSGAAPAALGTAAAVVMLMAWFGDLSVWWLRGAAAVLAVASIWRAIRCGFSEGSVCQPARTMLGGGR